MLARSNSIGCCSISLGVIEAWGRGTIKNVMNEKMMIQSLGERFHLSAKKTESACRAIRDAVVARKIKAADPEQTSLRYRHYIPFWA